jgi:hypothetical protein
MLSWHVGSWIATTSTPDQVKRAICSRLGVRDADVKVARHKTEDFLIVFRHPHHRDAALDRRSLTVSSGQIKLLSWRTLPYGDHCDLRYHVRLCLEGIPIHAWNESIAKRAVARSCDLDYVEHRSLRRDDRALCPDDTRALCLWAWTYNPSDIPKVTWLTLTGNVVAAHDAPAPPRGRRGLTFRVLVHLDLIESPLDDYGRTSTRELTWRHGVVDGEREPRPRHVSPSPEPRANRRNSDNDEDRGRRSDKGHNWGARLFRSLSRAPTRERERELSRSRHGR